MRRGTSRPTSLPLTRGVGGRSSETSAGPGYSWTLYSYRTKAYLLHEFVVMPDHFHVLITPTTSLEKAVQSIKGGFSHRVKVELGSSMEIWQKGFSDHRIRDAEDYSSHLTYIHENPVRKGFCVSATDFLYSSASPGAELDPVPLRLKPLASVANGTAEAAPFQNAQKPKPAQSVGADGTPRALPFQSRTKAHA